MFDMTSREVVQEKPVDDLRQVIRAIYEVGPAVYYPIYDDGAYGREITGTWDLKNPLVNLTNSGFNQT